MKQIPQQQEFLEEFGREHNDTVTQLVMVQLYGSETLLADLGLHYVQNMKELWGLFVLGEKLHFFAPASESPMSVMFRSATGSKPPVPQYACLSDCASFSASLNEKKGFLSFFFTHPDLILTVKITEGTENGTLYAQLNDKPANVVSLLSKYSK